MNSRGRCWRSVAECWRIYALYASIPKKYESRQQVDVSLHIFNVGVHTMYQRLDTFNVGLHTMYQLLDTFNVGVYTMYQWLDTFNVGDFTLREALQSVESI